MHGLQIVSTVLEQLRVDLEAGVLAEMSHDKRSAVQTRQEQRLKKELEETNPDSFDVENVSDVKHVFVVKYCLDVKI